MRWIFIWRVWHELILHYWAPYIEYCQKKYILNILKTVIIFANVDSHSFRKRSWQLKYFASAQVVITLGYFILLHVILVFWNGWVHGEWFQSENIVLMSQKYHFINVFPRTFQIHLHYESRLQYLGKNTWSKCWFLTSLNTSHHQGNVSNWCNFWSE